MTEAERDILETLTLRIPVLTLAQIERTWFPTGAPRDGAQTVGALARRGWLGRIPVKAHPELALAAPLATWEPGAPAPRFGPLAYQNRSRWTGAVEQTAVYVATRQAARTYGGVPGRVGRFHVTHDIHLAAVYLGLRRRDAAAAGRWVSEKALASEREDDVLPDAELRDAAGHTERVIEFVGSSYTARRLEDLFADAHARGVPIEFW